MPKDAPSRTDEALSDDAVSAGLGQRDLELIGIEIERLHALGEDTVLSLRASALLADAPPQPYHPSIQIPEAALSADSRRRDNLEVSRDALLAELETGNAHISSSAPRNRDTWERFHLSPFESHWISLEKRENPS